MGRRPPRLVLTEDLNAEGSISGVRVIANSRQLTAVPTAIDLAAAANVD
jgi:hypothetical protein